MALLFDMALFFLCERLLLARTGGLALEKQELLMRAVNGFVNIGDCIEAFNGPS